MITKTHLTFAFAMITLITLVIVIMGSSTSKINCNDPHTWSTASGVRQCAVNGGE